MCFMKKKEIVLLGKKLIDEKNYEFLKCLVQFSNTIWMENCLKYLSRLIILEKKKKKFTAK